jgi:putative two-component system response regulator
MPDLPHRFDMDHNGTPVVPLTSLFGGSETLLRSNAPLEQSKVLIIDDEPLNIRVVQKCLRNAGYENVVTTTDSRATIDLIRAERPDVILLDLMMPQVNGLQLLEVIRGDRRLHHLPVLILTAEGDEEVKDQALRCGATDFLAKPIRPVELLARLRNALIVKAHHDNLSAYSIRLELEVRQRTAELEQTRQEVIRVLACAAEYRDHETGNHVLRVGRFSALIARQLGFSPSRVDLIGQAAILHDVGKIGIPDSILLKPASLTDAEKEVMKQHCEYGLKILQCIPTGGRWKLNEFDHNLLSPVLRMAATISISHHERWDGKGYPRGLKGEEIPIEGRIVAVADVFDALSNERRYKDKFPLDECIKMMEGDRGTHFDPLVLSAFRSNMPEVLAIARELADETTPKPSDVLQ